MASEPSQTVQPPHLLQHIHLCVAVQYPYTPQPLQPERVLSELTKAPQVVRNRPVQWQYLSSPRDGTLLLTWQPRNQLGDIYASDGYVWSGPERVQRHSQDGYHINVSTAEGGFNPAAGEQFCAHRRARYRLEGSSNGTHDFQLELVQYLEAFPQHRIPRNQIPMNHGLQQILTQRASLERQGSLSERPFMLHDRMNYPTISLSRHNIPSNPYQQAAQIYGRDGNMARGPHPGAMARPGMGGSPPKRGQPGAGRVHGSQIQQSLPAAQPMPEYLKDEDNHVYGDALDFLTPREISSARYKQHHEWMEEVLSSPYDMKQILPVNLGLKIDGELGRLTEGLYSEQPQKEGGQFNGGIDPENIPELEKRVREYTQKGEAELREMKRVHRDKMEQMSQQNLYADLERKLTGQSTNADLDKVVREAEEITGLKVVEMQPVVQVSKGGIIEQVTEIQEGSMPGPDSQGFNDFVGMDSAGEALDMFSQNMDYTT